MKFSFYTDTHLTGQNPENRCDDFAEAVLDKIEQVYSNSKEHGCECVVFGGDLCNTHKIYSYKILERFISILKKNNIPTYFVVGQHDLYGYEKNSYNDSALCFIEKMSDGLFVKLENPIEVAKNIVLYPSHVYDDVIAKASEIPKDNKTNILVTHSLLSEKKQMFDTIQISDVKTNARMVLSGDLHCGVPYSETNGIKFYNSGALARTKCDDIERHLKMGLFDLNDDKIEFEEIILKYKNAEDVFYERPKEYVGSFDGFAEQIDTIESTVVDIFDLIDLWNRTTSDCASSELIGYILKFRKNK